MHAVFNGYAWHLSEISSWVEKNHGNILLDNNEQMQQRSKDTAKTHDPTDLNFSDPRFSEMLGYLQQGQGDAPYADFTQNETILVYMGKAARYDLRHQRFLDHNAYLCVILAKEESERVDSHWTRMGICTFTCVFLDLPGWQPFSGICW